MSKHHEHLNDRIPSYEESIATQPSSASQSAEEAPRLSIQQRNRLKRTRIVNELTATRIEPTVSHHLENGMSRTVAILLPSDAFPPTVSVQENNITSPALPPNTTLLRLVSDEHKSSFLHQPTVIQDLATAITVTLTDPDLLQASSSGPVASTTALPTRPAPKSKSSFRYMLGIPDPGLQHDPTGTTGQWNLGWRSHTDDSSTSAALSTDEMQVRIRLQDVSFRTESEMGLLESKSVKCVWCEVELKA